MKKQTIELEIVEYIKKLSQLDERQLNNASKAASYIKSVFSKHNISFATQKFPTYIPIGKSKLIVDGKIVPSMSCSYVSGKIENNFAISSSLISSRYLIDVPNISFNPLCDAISRSNMYFAPAIAVSRNDILKISKGKRVRASINVLKTKAFNEQILVGNTNNPKRIIFSHYDSIGAGAIDNASGTALMIAVAINSPECLKESLFVFDGNEELSYDNPTYWGRGYRDFFSQNNSVYQKRGLAKSTEKILVIDCLGYSEPILYKDKKISNLAFPVPDAMKDGIPVTILSGSFDSLMAVYHSNYDDGRMISEKYLSKTLAAFKKQLQA